MPFSSCNDTKALCRSFRSIGTCFRAHQLRLKTSSPQDREDTNLASALCKICRHDSQPPSPRLLGVNVVQICLRPSTPWPSQPLSNRSTNTKHKPELLPRTPPPQRSHRRPECPRRHILRSLVLRVRHPRFHRLHSFIPRMPRQNPCSLLGQP